MEWGIVSHIIRYYFNPCGTGSHLYSANTNTLRSVHWVEVLLALVGTHISWSPHPPLLCFHYTTHCGICQALFCQSLYFSEKPLDLNLVVFRGSFPSPAWNTPIISQLRRFVKGFLTFLQWLDLNPHIRTHRHTQPKALEQREGKGN